MSEAQPGDMSPQEAAAALEGDDTFDDENFTEGPISESEGDPADALGSDSVGLVDRLLSTEPNPPLESVESPWNPDVGGPSRIYRGVMKLGDIDGLPAVVDILIGIAETAESKGLLDGDGDGDGDGHGDGDRADPADESGGVGQL